MITFFKKIHRTVLYKLRSRNVIYNVFDAARITLRAEVVVCLTSRSVLFNLALCVGPMGRFLQCPDPSQGSDQECVFSSSSLVEHHSAL